MNRAMGFDRFCVVALSCALLAVPNLTAAMGIEAFGNRPVLMCDHGRWPGLEKVVNQSFRVYRQWVNGSESLCYRGDLKALNEGIRAFADIQADVHEVVIRRGPGIMKSFQDKEIEHDWRIEITGGIALSVKIDQTEGQAKDFPPTMIIYVDDERLPFDRLEIPETVIVRRDDVPGDDAELASVRR